MGSSFVEMAPRKAEVLMVEPDLVRRMEQLAKSGWGAKAIARELGIARNTVRRYLRGGSAAQVQVRPRARTLSADAMAVAVALFEGEAEGNSAVVRALLKLRGVRASLRTVQRALAPHRQRLRAAAVASVRFESAPGQQMQIDFGQKRVRVAGRDVVVHLLVAVLSYSRRIFVRAFLRERGDDWREGIAAAFTHFGGVPGTLLGDNARALVVSRNREAGTVEFHPAYLAFCRDWGTEPRACGPYRARTKGKGEAGVKYVKRNALAGRTFDSFAQLEAHLAEWIVLADVRVHGTTRERPVDRFERAERAALKPLPARPLPVRVQRLKRRVAHDALVDVDTVRYSVPHRLVREHVEVHVTEERVQIFFASELVAEHARSREPHARVVDPAHWDGLWRAEVEPAAERLPELGRALSYYADVLGQGVAA